MEIRFARVISLRDMISSCSVASVSTVEAAKLPEICASSTSNVADDEYSLGMFWRAAKLAARPNIAARMRIQLRRIASLA
jgi:hypothetical protein